MSLEGSCTARSMLRIPVGARVSSRHAQAHACPRRLTSRACAGFGELPHPARPTVGGSPSHRGCTWSLL
jgi:hypothetical protein